MTPYDIIASSPAFSGIERPHLRELMLQMELRPFQRGQRLWAEGENVLRLVILLEGRVKLIKQRNSGRDMIVDLVGPGAILGLTSSPDGGQPMGVLGISQGLCASVDRQHFLQRLERFPKIAINLAKAMALERDALVCRFEEMTNGSVEARLAALLNRLIEQCGAPEGGGMALNLPLSRQDLADMVDTTVETAIRIMSRWNREQIVLTRREGFLVPSLDILYERAS